MLAMVLEEAGRPLEPMEVAAPEPGPGTVRMRVRACGVCRTDLHIVDGELTEPRLPLIPGHQAVGEIVECGPQVEDLVPGQRVGVPWLAWTCGRCDFCSSGQENLCDHARFTGYHVDGGFAQEMNADARFVLPLPAVFSDIQAAPLLCAGLIGYRAYRMASEVPGGVRRLGLYGFGAAAHILAQVAAFQGREVFAFTRPGDDAAQELARGLGAAWAGASDEPPPEALDAAIIFAPVGALVPIALRSVRKGGTVVCGGIHMSDIPTFPYDALWGERILRSVANLQRRDGAEFLALAASVPVRTHVTSYPLEGANDALSDLRDGSLHGAAVLALDSGG
jgi:alcohol dehydrogenase, propanol-preferring